jgi:hypothetical protein
LRDGSGRAQPPQELAKAGSSRRKIACRHGGASPRVASKAAPQRSAAHPNTGPDRRSADLLPVRGQRWVGGGCGGAAAAGAGWTKPQCGAA